MTIPHREKTINYGTNICTPQEFDFTSILYAEIAKLNSWNKVALSISLFETNDFMEIDSNNISTSLLKIANFIKKQKYYRKNQKKISLLLQVLNKWLGSSFPLSTRQNGTI